LPLTETDRCWRLVRPRSRRTVRRVASVDRLELARTVPAEKPCEEPPPEPRAALAMLGSSTIAPKAARTAKTSQIFRVTGHLFARRFVARGGLGVHWNRRIFPNAAAPGKRMPPAPRSNAAISSNRRFTTPIGVGRFV